MTERDKLIEILNTVIYPREGADPEQVVVDFLLDNGVKIPVLCGECIHREERNGTVWCEVWENYNGHGKCGWCCHGERRAENEKTAT